MTGAPRSTLGSSTAVVAVANLASRVTGFVRVVLVGTVLGVSFLANTYQSANVVPNIAFEVLAAGALSAVLVPGLVRSGAGAAPRLAGSVLGLALVVLGLAVILGVALRVPIMRALTVGVADDEVRRRQVELGSFLLLIFLPQLLLYAVGAVATALLHARQRFTAAALAPVANNLVVVATLSAFWLAGSRSVNAALEVSDVQRWILAVGTTAGVAAMTALPVLALRRARVRWRPRWEPRGADLARLATEGGWAGAQIALGQVLVLTTVVLANRVEGGVVVTTIAYQVFLLPFALLAHPVATTLFPRLAAATGTDWAAMLDRGVAILAMVVLPATVLVAILAVPALGMLQVGGIDQAAATLTGQVVVAYAVGIPGWCALALFTRAGYSAGDARSPAVVMAVVALGGAAAMVVAAWLIEGPSSLVALAGAHSAAVTAGGWALGMMVRRGRGPGRDVALSLRRSLLAALVAGAGAGAVLVGASATVGVGRSPAAAMPDTAVVATAVALAAGVGLAGFLAVRSAPHRRHRAGDPPRPTPELDPEGRDLLGVLARIPGPIGSWAGARPEIGGR